MLTAGRTYRLIEMDETAVVLSPFENTETTGLAMGLDSAEMAARSAAQDKQAVGIANQLSDAIDDSSTLRSGITSELSSLKVGINYADRSRNVRQMYANYKKPVGIGLAAAAIVGAGYYMYNKSQESSVYDETMEDQPIEASGQVRRANSSFQANAGMTSSRRDPLTTAGVVGNLDRSKIGHTRMGPDKYDHLYGR
jgi:hypothetical protein